MPGSMRDKTTGLFPETGVPVMAPGGDRHLHKVAVTGIAAELAAAQAELAAVRAEFAEAAAAAAQRLERTEQVLAATAEALCAATGSAVPPEPAPPELAAVLASPPRAPYQGIRLPGGAVAVLRACRETADAALIWQQVRSVLEGR